MTELTTMLLKPWPEYVTCLYGFVRLLKRASNGTGGILIVRGVNYEGNKEEAPKKKEEPNG